MYMYLYQRLDEEYSGWYKCVRAFDIAYEEESITLNITPITEGQSLDFEIQPLSALEVQALHVYLCSTECALI